jgi:predicted Zn-dependent protease
LLLTLLLLATTWVPGEATSAPDDRFASTERARYAALCRARKDLDSCSDAVRWSPGDPALIAALADTLVRAGRIPEALRDYRRAESLEPDMRGLGARIKAAEARLNERNKPRKAPVDRATADAAAAKRFSNVDPEAQSH